MTFINLVPLSLVDEHHDNSFSKEGFATAKEAEQWIRMDLEVMSSEYDWAAESVETVFSSGDYDGYNYKVTTYYYEKDPRMGSFKSAAHLQKITFDEDA